MKIFDWAGPRAMIFQNKHRSPMLGPARYRHVAGLGAVALIHACRIVRIES